MHDCDATQVDAGQQISRAGDVRDEAFLLLTGELFVGAADAGAPEERERKRAGEFVGEKAFLSGHKRVHDICEGQHCWVWKKLQCGHYGIYIVRCEDRG